MRKAAIAILFGLVLFTGCTSGGESCTPDCTGKECGADGCGDFCGFCPVAAPVCNDAGKCVADCTPDCTGRECGGNGCGGTCGSCPGAAPFCNDFGKCVAECIADCIGRECGSDGCGGTCGTCPEAAPHCGDQGVCYGDCVPDCAGKECGDDGCGEACGICTNGTCKAGLCGCTDHYDCDDVSICYQGSCDTAYGRKYRITFVSATIEEIGPDGKTWDSIGGAPDPYISYKFDNTTGVTATKQDTLVPAWNESVDTTLFQSQDITITVKDEDMAANDIVETFELDAIPMWALKDEGLIFAGDYCTELVVTVEPK